MLLSLETWSLFDSIIYLHQHDLASHIFCRIVTFQWTSFPATFLKFQKLSHLIPFEIQLPFWDEIMWGFFACFLSVFRLCVCVCCYCWAMWFFCIWVLRCFSRHAHPQCTCCCPWYWNAFSCLVGLNPGPFRYSFLWNLEMRPTCTYYCFQHPFV